MLAEWARVVSAQSAAQRTLAPGRPRPLTTALPHGAAHSNSSTAGSLSRFAQPGSGAPPDREVGRWWTHDSDRTPRRTPRLHPFSPAQVAAAPEPGAGPIPFRGAASGSHRGGDTHRCHGLVRRTGSGCGTCAADLRTRVLSCAAVCGSLWSGARCHGVRRGSSVGGSCVCGARSGASRVGARGGGCARCGSVRCGGARCGGARRMGLARRTTA